MLLLSNYPTVAMDGSGLFWTTNWPPCIRAVALKVDQIAQVAVVDIIYISKCYEFKKIIKYYNSFFTCFDFMFLKV